jgi:4-hydroxy-tetrahydrodipicolinate reductase
MLNVMVVGSRGKMGRELLALIESSEELTLSGEIHRNSSFEGCGKPDVIVDFSQPEVVSSMVDWALSHKVPVVSGTTGLSSDQHKEFERLSKSVPVLWSSNMSLGVAWLNRILPRLAELGEDFDFRIEEFHHRHKRDNPSGTALTLQKTLEASISSKLEPPVGIRGGGIYGIHNVWAMSDEESLLLQHTALNGQLTHWSNEFVRKGKAIEGPLNPTEGTKYARKLYR